MSAPTPPFVVRSSTEQDVPDIAGIYRHYILHTNTTFEVTPPTAEEVPTRRSQILQRQLPHLVAEEQGRAVGCAYAHEYCLRPAYRSTVEDSIYLDPHYVGSGKIAAKNLRMVG